MLVDGHCDTIREAWKRNLSLTDNLLNFNITEAKMPMIQMMAIYISPEEAKEGYETAEKMIKKLKKEIDQYKNKIIQIDTKKKIDKIGKDKIGMILTIENGSAIEGNLENIDKLYHTGIRMMSIVWNESNELASGALEKEDKGLTQLGKQYIKHLNKKKIIVDVSHSSQKTFWDVAKISNRPIIASHSCVYQLCHHPRNLTDDQIKQIAKSNGIIGIAFCNQFLNENKKATVEDIVNHIKYITNLVGVDYVGIGSDFDGLDEEDILPDIKGIKDIYLIEIALRKSGFRQNEIEKILGENWIRILKENIE